MYQKVLLPLDGSKLAECVLPHVKNLAAQGVVEEIILLHVIEVPSIWGGEFDPLAYLNAQTDASDKYLTDIKSQLISESININTEILGNDIAHSAVADLIVEYVTKNNIDLIIIATHGYTGLKRVMFGSVALRVLHDVHVPVLVIRPDAAMK